MLAPVIGSPASSSQNMISRYSCSATVAFSDDTSSPLGPAFHQRGDDRLVEAVAHAAFGNGDIVPTRQRGPQTGVVLGAVGDEEEAADRGGDLEVLDRVADGDALGWVVAAGAGVAGDRRRLADLPGDQVVGVGAALDGRHRAADGAVVEQAQV